MSKTIDYRQGVNMEIELRKGATWKRQYHVQYYDSGNTLQDFDWSNYSGATLQVRIKPNSPIAELSLSTDEEITLKDNGRFEIEVTYEIMDGLRAGEYDYDMYLSGTDISKRDFLYGKFIVYNKISK